MIGVRYGWMDGWMEANTHTQASQARAVQGRAREKKVRRSWPQRWPPSCYGPNRE